MIFYLCLSHWDRVGDHKALCPPSHAAESGVASRSGSWPGVSNNMNLYIPVMLSLSKKLKEGTQLKPQEQTSLVSTNPLCDTHEEGRNYWQEYRCFSLLQALTVGKNECQGSSKHKHTKHALVCFVKLISKHKHTRAITNCKPCSVQGFSSLFAALLLLASAERYENTEIKSRDEPQKSRDIG